LERCYQKTKGRGRVLEKYKRKKKSAGDEVLKRQGHLAF